MKKKYDEAYIIAIHEAGHAVAHLAFKQNLRSVSIVPHHNFKGQAKSKIKKSLIKQLDSGIRTPSTYQYFKEQMISSLAGQAAVARLLKERFHQEGAGKDLKDSVDLAYELYIDKKVVEAYFNYIIEEANFFVKIPRNWSAIKLIAKELIKKKYLNKKQSIEIYNSVFFK